MKKIILLISCLTFLIGESYSIDNSNNDSYAIRIGNLGDIYIGDSFSIMGWIKVDSIGNDFSCHTRIIHSKTGPPNEKNIVLAIHTNGILNFNVSSGVSLYAEDHPIPLNTWFNFACTYGNNQKIYINGVQVASTQISNDWTIFSDPCYIGGGPVAPCQQFFGNIDRLSFWKVSLTEMKLMNICN